MRAASKSASEKVLPAAAGGFIAAAVTPRQSLEPARPAEATIY